MRTNQFEIAEQHIIVQTSSLESSITKIKNVRNSIIEALDNKDIIRTKKYYEQYLEELQQYQKEGNELAILADVAMQYFYFELNAQGEEESSSEKMLLKRSQKIPKLKFIWPTIKDNFILSSSAIEIRIKYLLSTRNKTILSQIYNIQGMLRQLILSHPQAKRYAKGMMTILVHMMINKINTSVNYEEKIIKLCQIIIRDMQSHPQLFTIDTSVAVLYNCLKTLLGMKHITKKSQLSLFRLYQALKCKEVLKYQDHLLHLFFIIKGFIFRKGKAMEGEENHDSSDQEIDAGQEGVRQKLSIWTSISLDQTSLALEEVTRNIIRHRVASLATIIGIKLSLPSFCLNFLELMHDGPFNNQAQTIKLCFQLFEAREYQRLNACLQVVLKSPSCKNLRERQILLSMCTIFTGLYQRDREQALLYAKLNHHQNKKLILREQTLLQNVGFAYLDLASHEIYTCNRQAFQIQAMNVLKKSTEVNPKNYLTQYCLGKLLLRMGDLEGAYEHAKLSIMTGRGQWMPFSLLACIYFCQRRFSKSVTLIDQLLNKYKQNKVLFYIKSYLQVNQMLLQVEYDQEVEAAKQLGEQIYDIVKERVLKSKSSTNLLKYLQFYHQLHLANKISQFDQNYFYHMPAMNQQMGMFQTFAVGYQETQGEQAILQIIPLLLQAGLHTLAQGLLKKLPSSPLKSYQMGLLYEAKGEKGKAITEYKTVLSQQPYNTPTLINLSLLVQDLGDALHFIDRAQKLTSDHKLWLAKGVLYSQLGKIAQAHELFLKQGQKGWLDMQPDLTYYY